MSQSKGRSFKEAVVNVGVGVTVMFTAQVIIFPWFGIHIGLDKNLGISVCFTAISLARSYLIRRWFNRGDSLVAVDKTDWCSDCGAMLFVGVDHECWAREE